MNQIRQLDEKGQGEDGRGPHGCGAPRRALSAASTSPASGKRPSAFFEKTRSPSSVTSKAPVLPLIRVPLIPSFCSIESARPAARGR